MPYNSRKNKMLVSLVVLLLLTNCVSLYFMFNSNKELNKSHDEKQVEYMRRELGLDEAQLKKYKELRVYRDSIMEPLNLALRETKLKIVDYLRQPNGMVPDSMIRQLAREISDRQQEIEFAYYQHFRRVQDICKPEQLPLFDSVIIKMIYRTTGKR